MNRTKVLTVFLAAGMALSVPLAAFAKNPHSGGGGGGGGSMAGGLPGLTKRVIADEAFLRESILNPSAKVVKGYQPNIMPVFEGQINEEGLLQLIVYIKSLSDTESAPQSSATTVKAVAKGSSK